MEIFSWLFRNMKLERKRRWTVVKILNWQICRTFLSVSVSPLKNCPSSAQVSATASSAMVSSPPRELDKCLDSLQDERSTRFARIEAFRAINNRADPVFSAVKALVAITKSPVATVSKTPFLYPSIFDRSGWDPVPDNQHEFKIKTLPHDLYGNSALQQEPVISSCSSAPAGSVAERK